MNCNFILIDDDQPRPTERRSPNIATPNTARADKFRDLADSMQSAIDDKLSDRQTNTPKRMQQASYARLDGEHLQRTQQALRKLADLPDVLPRITTKKAVHNLTRSEQHRGTGYYSPSTCTGKPYIDSQDSLTLWSLLTGKSDAEEQADKLRDMINGLSFSNIPGYFATSEKLINQMFEYLNVQPGHKFLEPEAGSGGVADKARGLGAIVDCCEIWPALRNILELKGHNLIAGDFLGHEAEYIGADYDRIAMNPPFEKLQDIAHVMKAYYCLNGSGIMTSIMSPGPFYRKDQKCVEFRRWFDQVGGYKIDIEAGEFKQSGTMVSTVMIIIEK